MIPLTYNDIAINDLVLLETTVMKWRPPNADRDSVQFRLDSVSLLCDGEPANMSGPEVLNISF